jgi:hypothetical protein
MTFTGYVACICEGSSERAILDLLLENCKLVFDRKQMLDHELLHCRSPREFEMRYLNFEYEHPINVVRILDSRREQFNLRKPYQDIVRVFNVITAPEIEMLIIIAEGKLADFKKFDIKPSEYCKGQLGYKQVKNFDFVSGYFTDVDMLVRCIQEYKRVSRIKTSEYTLCDMLK